MSKRTLPEEAARRRTFAIIAHPDAGKTTLTEHILLAGGAIRLGSLDPRRDMTFVTDTAAGFIAAAESDAALGRTVQLGTGTDHSIGEIVETVGEILGRELDVELDEQRVRPPDSEGMRLISSPALASELMGWKPTVDLREGLERTLKWIEANLHRYRVGDYVR